MGDVVLREAAEAHALQVFLFVGARGLEEQDGDAAGGDVVAAEVGDEALELFEPAGAALVGVEVHGAAVDARFDAVAGARHVLGGFDGEEGLARPCPAVDEDSRGVVEDGEDDALLLGELVELLADVVEDGVGGGDEVEVAAEVVGDGVDGVGGWRVYAARGSSSGDSMLNRRPSASMMRPRLESRGFPFSERVR